MYLRNTKSILSKYKGILSKYKGILSKYKSILSKYKYTFKLHKYTFKEQKFTLEVRKYTLEVQKYTVEKKPKNKVVESAIWFNWFTCTVWGLCWYHFHYEKDDHQLSRCLFFLQKRPLLLLLKCWIGIKKSIAPILEAQVPPEPGTEQLTAPWIRKQIGGFFRFILETARCRTEVQMPFSAFTKDEHLWLH